MGRFHKVFFVICAVLVARGVAARTCTPEDFDHRVSGATQCLLMRHYGDPAGTPDALVVWLHGDVSSGGPANYHFPYAQQLVGEEYAKRVVSVALVRPGYPDGSGENSGADEGQGERSDHYTRENLTEVATAIAHLREHYKPARLVVVGHSGGAATTASLIGMQPGLVDVAVLVSCPCDTVAWRAGRRAWSRSENPLDWAAKVPATPRVIAITGDKDENTAPDLARRYVQALQAAKVNASFLLAPGENHNSSYRPATVFLVLKEVLTGK